jgi:acetyl-CoA acetyltransferase
MSAVIAGVGQSAYTRRPEPGFETRHFIRDAVMAALRDSGIDARDIDGFAVSSLSLAPDTSIDLAWQLGLRLKWLLQDPNGGVAGLNMLDHAVRAVDAGAADCVLICAGDAFGRAGQPGVALNFNTAVRDLLAPLGHGGANGVFSLVTLRQMRKFGLDKSDYGHVAIAQRQWAQLNPAAVYREPLTMEEYLASPSVAGPLARFDCVPVVAGAQAIIVTRSDRASLRHPQVRIKAIGTSFNHDHQQGDGLTTGITTFVEKLWRAAGVGPTDIDLFSIYDDYPAMMLAQLNDLGLIPGQDIKRFVREVIGARKIPINTHGGMLSAGQPGGPAGGLHGIAEAVVQLQQRAGDRQVPSARLALVTGYGMTMYRYGGAAAAAILERAS